MLGDQERASSGWPLGLQPLSLRLRLLEHLRFTDAASLLASTPSITSESSSDLDTESTGSFFPEKSTTLGRLIGIQSSTSMNESRTVEQQLLEAKNSRRRSTGSYCSCCPFLLCTSSDSCQESMSPSLAHLLELERRAALSEMQETSQELTDEDGDPIGRSFSNNTLFDDDDTIRPPQQSGAPLRLILQQSSPRSTYLSGDWSDCVAVFNRAHNRRDQPNSNRFWSSICGRLTTSLAD